MDIGSLGLMSSLILTAGSRATDQHSIKLEAFGKSVVTTAAILLASDEAFTHKALKALRANSASVKHWSPKKLEQQVT
jgi:hypothetical protein